MHDNGLAVRMRHAELSSLALVFQNVTEIHTVYYKYIKQ